MSPPTMPSSLESTTVTRTTIDRPPPHPVVGSRRKREYRPRRMTILSIKEAQYRLCHVQRISHAWYIKLGKNIKTRSTQFEGEQWKPPKRLPLEWVQFRMPDEVRKELMQIPQQRCKPQFIGSPTRVEVFCTHCCLHRAYLSEIRFK